MPFEASSAHEAEVAVLRALISAGIKRKASQPERELTAILPLLANYSWIDHEHRIVYQAFCGALRNQSIPLREQMAAEATRMGHPDVDWPLYLEPPDPGDARVSDLVQTLRKINMGLK